MPFGEHPHVELLIRFPELGRDFGLRDVLEAFAQFVWEADVEGREELVRRAFAFVERLAEGQRPDLALMSVSALFFDLDEKAIERLGIGPRTAQLITERDANA